MNLDALSYTWFFRPTDEANRRAILRLLEDGREGDWVLDLGCSSGEFSQQIGKRTGSKHLYGVDIRADKLAEAKKGGLEVLQSDLSQPLPLDAESFDVIVSNQVIEHLTRVPTFVRELWRLLKWGGYAIVSTPNLASLHNAALLLLGITPPTFREGRVDLDADPTIHRQFFTPQSLRRLFEQANFKVERQVNIGFYPFPPAVAKVLQVAAPRHCVYTTLKMRKQR